MSSPLVILPVKQGARARIDLAFQAGRANYDLIRDVMAPKTVQVKVRPLRTSVFHGPVPRA